MKARGVVRLLTVLIIIAAYFSLVGCAPKVPMASPELNMQQKQFPPPTVGMAGVYVYRDSMYGAAIMDNISIDDGVVGQVAVNTFLYREVEPGPHIISIPTEFSMYKLELNAEEGQSYYYHYFVRMGVFRGNGAFEEVEESKAQEAISRLNLAQ